MKYTTEHITMQAKCELCMSHAATGEVYMHVDSCNLINSPKVFTLYLNLSTGVQEVIAYLHTSHSPQSSF